MSRRFWLPRYAPDSFESIQRPPSKQTKRWLLKLAEVKFQIEMEALTMCEHTTEKGSSRIYVERSHWGRGEGFLNWSQNLKKRALESLPVAEGEASTFIVDQRGLPGWRVAHQYCYLANGLTAGLEGQLQHQRVPSSNFVHLSIQLLETVVSGHVDDLSTLSEITDAIELQLSVLGSFGEIYHRHISESGTTIYDDFTWHRDIRPRIRDAIKQDGIRKASGNLKFTRSPSQRQQDNLLLQALLGILLLACIYPLYRALKSSSPAPGSPLDADFWQQILNVILQFAGFFTMLLPIYRETIAKEWVGTWILSILGILSALVTVPLYLLAPISWSTFFSWLGASTQLLVVLQLALVATFRDVEHAKQG